MIPEHSRKRYYPFCFQMACTTFLICQSKSASYDACQPVCCSPRVVSLLQYSGVGRRNLISTQSGRVSWPGGGRACPRLRPKGVRAPYCVRGLRTPGSVRCPVTRTTGAYGDFLYPTLGSGRITHNGVRHTGRLRYHSHERRRYHAGDATRHCRMSV